MNTIEDRPTLTIYRAEGCHLCDDAEAMVRDELAMRVRAGLPPVEVMRVDISSDPDLETRFRRRIPVLAIGDDEVMLVTNATQVRELFARALPTTA